MPIFVWVAIALATLIVSFAVAARETLDPWREMLNGPLGWGILVLVAGSVIVGIVRNRR